MKKLFLILFTAAVCLTACGPKTTYTYPFQDPSLTWEERIENLLTLLTPEEKIGLLMNKSVSVDSLGIPAYNWWSEACHGIVADGYTVYPQTIGLAATFDPELVYDIYTTVSDEARANWNRSRREWNVDDHARYYPGNPELSFWCPNINIFRDPRWGRGQETAGEDPYLTSVIGLQTVLGMQGNDRHYLKTHACAKHYAVHSGPERLRHSMDVSVSLRDLWETYLPAFRTLVVDGHVREVMGAYQRYEGVPCTMNDRLLVDILRDKWGYDGIVLTDCDAVNNYFMPGQHMTHADPAHAAADALRHGTDLECGRTFRHLAEALEQGLITVEDLDHALRTVLRGRLELGLFDPEEMSPWKDLKPEVISCEEHHALAVRAAREAMVLLKNDGVLPLSRDVKRIAVVGPNADDVKLLNGNYSGTPTPEHTCSILEGIRAALPETEVVYDKACDLVDREDALAPADFEALAASLGDVEAYIVVGGISPQMEGEGGDKADIEVPAVQQRLLKALHATGRPVILVNCSGSALAFASIDPDCDAILQAWYGGEGAAQAVAEILLGECNPSGRLPVTFYASTDQLPDFLDYDMEGHTYRYFRGKPQYPFGYGLSYTTFAYGQGRLSKSSVKAGKGVRITVPVTNTGDRAGDEVVQVYVKSLDNPDAPIKGLKGFRRVSIEPGATRKVTVDLAPDAFSYYDGADGLAILPGRYRILYGSSSADEDLQALDFEVL